MSNEALESRVGRLEKALEAFAEEIRLAYRYMRPDAASSLTKSRMILEKLVVRVYTDVMAKEPRKPLLGEMLGDNQFTRHIERRILSRMNAIRDLGNLGPHGERVETSDASRVLEDLCEVLDWYLQKYTRPNTLGYTATAGAQNAPDQAEAGNAEQTRPHRSSTTLKYYVYVSRSKVEMLYAQIPPKERQDLAIKLGLELPHERGQLPGSSSVDEVLLAKTNLVVGFLEEQGLVGTVSQPKSFFKGHLGLRWGPYEIPFGCNAGPTELVYFGGATENTIIGLGGSLHHVIGHVGEATAHSHSATPVLVNVLSRELGITSEDVPEPPPPAHLGEVDRNWRALRAVELASTQMKGPVENIEFVARTLLTGESSIDLGGRSGRQVLLGSPIYAALVDA